MDNVELIRMLARYKKWASGVIYSEVMKLPEGEAYKLRKTNFGNMVRTLNHIYVVDKIFQAHIEKRDHGYTSRNTEITPDLQELWADQQVIDQWFVDLSCQLDSEGLSEIIDFPFIDGGRGQMTVGEIILHLVNHGTYHRGFVSDMMNQIGVVPAGSDFSIFTQVERAKPLSSTV